MSSNLTHAAEINRVTMFKATTPLLSRLPRPATREIATNGEISNNLETDTGIFVGVLVVRVVLWLLSACAGEAMDPLA